MLIYTHRDGAKACAPLGKPEDLELAKHGFESFYFLLNSDQYRNKPVSWETFANLIESYCSDPRAVAIVAAIRRCTTVVNPDFEKPEGLSKEGTKAYDIICKFLTERELTYTGKCKTFYSPQEWHGKGEEYGQGSELIIVYDGGDVIRAFNPEEGAWATVDALQAKLMAAGLLAERCTQWYSAIYKE